jgi:hypothetical protein
MMIAEATPSVDQAIPKPAKPPHIKGISRDRLLTLARHGFRCVYCGMDFLSSISAFYHATCDHLQPKARGGIRTPDNMVACCTTNLKHR